MGRFQNVALLVGVVLHRLNRVEYDNTVRDLLGSELRPAREFPPDDRVAGFDNVAANLSLSPLHLEMAELAALALADEALGASRPVEPVSRRIEGESGEAAATAGAAGGEYWNLWSEGSLVATVDVPIGGDYELTAQVTADQAGPELARMALLVDGFEQLVVDVEASRGTTEVHTVEVELEAGPHQIGVAFLNDFYAPDTGEDRNLLVDWFELYGPTNPPAVSEGASEVVSCDPEQIGVEDCATQVVSELAPRAWRRPLTGEEETRLRGLVQSIVTRGGTFDDAVRYGMAAVLTSPHFLYRVELVPEPGSEEPHPLSGYEIASRLSYFLWSSMPDEALFEAARAGQLDTVEGIREQVRRMLVDDKAAALVQNFGGQWLFIRGIDDFFKDPLYFPDFDDALRASMKEEMVRFFETFVFGDRDLRELLTATEGEIDGLLAAHYGLPDGAAAQGWQTVDLTGIDRGGLLGQGGLLAITSYPTRTSPVIRGKFVLGQLLCDEPPPPPPGVEGLEEEIAAKTLREQLEQHRADPQCAVCHETMDELGFALEKFDAVGRVRTEDRGLPVDARGQLPDGTSFEGAREMGRVVARDPRFPRCVAKQLFTYGLGRVPRESGADDAELQAITAAFEEGGRTFEALAIAVATSRAFRFTRGESP